MKKTRLVIILILTAFLAPLPAIGSRPAPDRKVRPDTVLQRLARYWHEHGDDSRACHYYRRAFEAKDSIAAAASAGRVVPTHKDYELDDLLQSNRRQQKRQARLVRAMMGTALAVAVAVYVYVRRRRRKLRAAHRMIAARQRVCDEKTHGKSAFLSDLAREMQAPLNAIVGCSDILSENVGNVTVSRQIHEIIRNNTRTLLDAIDRAGASQSRSMARHATDVRLCRLDVVPLCHSVVESVGMPRADFESRLSHLTLATDPVHLQQILTDMIHVAAGRASADTVVHLRIGTRRHAVVFSTAAEGAPTAAGSDSELLADCRAAAAILGGSLSTAPGQCEFVHPTKPARR